MFPKYSFRNKSLWNYAHTNTTICAVSNQVKEMAGIMTANYHQEIQNSKIVAACCSVIISIVLKQRARRRQNRKTWVKEWILNQPSQRSIQQLISWALSLWQSIIHKLFKNGSWFFPRTTGTGMPINKKTGYSYASCNSSRRETGTYIKVSGNR